MVVEGIIKNGFFFEYNSAAYTGEVSLTGGRLGRLNVHNPFSSGMTGGGDNGLRNYNGSTNRTGFAFRKSVGGTRWLNFGNNYLGVSESGDDFAS